MNRVIAVFANNGTMATTQTPLWQYDYGQILVIQGLQLPQAYEVHFCNSTDTTTITSIGNADGVEIPDQFLRSGERIYAYVYLHTGEDDGETEYKITIPVMDRAEPTDIEPTPAQESTIGQLITALNDAVDTAEEAASKGPIIQNGYWFIWDSTAGEYVTTDVKAEGVDGVDGSGVWYTTDRISGGENPFVSRRSLIGREGATVQVHDLLFAPDVEYDGTPTTLYEITSVGIACNLNRLCKVQGEPGEDGYAPVVTIEQITGGYRITITSAAHPDGQSFDVMDGTDGQDGNKIWYTDRVFRSTSVSGHLYVAHLTDLTGNDADPVVGDYVFGPESGTGGSENLYIINEINVANANLTKIGSIEGAAGQDGTTFTPSVSAAGVLSWENDGGKQNPGSVDLVAAVLDALPTWDGGSY